MAKDAVKKEVKLSTEEKKEYEVALKMREALNEACPELKGKLPIDKSPLK